MTTLPQMDGTSAARRSPIVRRPPFGNNPLVGERGSDTQRRILRAAIDVFADVGYHDGRVELITEQAGCSRPAFYQYFSSKDDVFWTLAGELGHEMVDLGRQLSLGPMTPDAEGVTALAEWIDEFLTLYEAYAPVFSAFQAASRDHQPMAKGSSTISDRLGEALLQAFDTHGRRPSEDAALATAVVAILIRCCFYWQSMPSVVSRQRMVDGLAQIVHRLFFGPIADVNIPKAGKARRRPPLVAVPQPPSAERHRGLHPRGEKTRQRLLEAGAKVLPARGYHDARVDDIVEVAGVSHGSFYRYFENKDDLFRVLAEEASGQLIVLLDAFPQTANADELRSWLGVWFATYESNGGVISTWQEMEYDDPGMISFSQQVAASVVARLMRMLGKRTFGDPTVDALALLALIERVPYGVFTLRFTDRADAIEAMITIVRRGFMGL